MATGYTYKVSEGTMTSLRDFALECVRALGVCITMRDEPMSAPIPQAFEPSAHYKESLDTAEAELARVKALTPEEVITKAEEYHLQRVGSNMDARGRHYLTKKRYDAMREKVVAWDCKVEGLKEFMLQQLDESLKWDCFDAVTLDKYYPLDLPRQTPEEWHEKTIAAAQRDVDYHAEQYQKEISRTADRNDYLRRFWECLPEA